MICCSKQDSDNVCDMGVVICYKDFGYWFVLILDYWDECANGDGP